MDLLEIKSEFCEPMMDQISGETGVPRDCIFIACTHTHTGPQLDGDEAPVLRSEYVTFLGRRLSDAGRMALQDMSPARMGWGTAHAPGIAFIRRFRMKDGTIHTNPGIFNPDVIGPVGEIDDRVSAVRLDREGKDSILIAHFAVHPDTIGGCVISADWPGWTRRFAEKAIEHVKCVVFNGAIGDVNHVNTQPAGGYMNDLKMDFDDCVRGYGHSRHMNRRSDAFLGISMTAPERDGAFAALEEEGRIVKVQAEGIRSALYMRSEDLRLMESVLAGTADRRARLEFLAPLDPMLWDRKLIEALWDFRYS